MGVKRRTMMIFVFTSSSHNETKKAEWSCVMSVVDDDIDKKRQNAKDPDGYFEKKPTQWLLIPWVNIECLSKTSEKADWEWVTMHMNYHFCNMTRHRSLLLWSTSLTFRKVVRPVNSVHKQLVNAYCIALLLFIILNQRFAPQEHDTNKRKSGDVS